jgi:hypothetical protein
MSQMGQQRLIEAIRCESALPLISDILLSRTKRRLGPLPQVADLHSITSSARDRNDSGIVSPSASGREIDHKIEFGRLFDRHVAGLGTSEDLVDKVGSAPEQRREVWST